MLESQAKADNYPITTLFSRPSDGLQLLLLQLYFHCIVTFYASDKDTDFDDSEDQHVLMAHTSTVAASLALCRGVAPL